MDRVNFLNYFHQTDESGRRVKFGLVPRKSDKVILTINSPWNNKVINVGRRREVLLK